MALSRDQILGAPKPELVEVQVPAFGGSVFVKPFTIGVSEKFYDDNAAAKGADYSARLIVATVVDEAGSPLFTDADIPAIREIPAQSLKDVVQAALRANRILDDPVGDAEKN